MYRHKFALMERDARFEIGLICPKAWGAQSAEMDLETPPYYFRQLDIRLNGHNHFHTYVGLARAIDDFQPDVLNIEEEHYSLVTAQAFLLAKKRGIPAIFYTWQNIAKTYPPPFSWIEKMVLGQAAVAVGGNAESIAILRQKGYQGPCMQIPQMGINLEFFAPRTSGDSERKRAKSEQGLNPEQFWIGFVGRLVEEKGIQVLLKALALSPKQMVHALILGDGPYASHLQKMADDLGIASRVQFVPFVPSAAVPSYLRAIDALCLPSLTRPNWKEQFGRVLTEAMASEAVILGSSSGEIPHVIGDSGLVHPEGDAATLSSQISLLVESPDLLQHLKAKGAERVRANFTNDMIASHFGEAFLLAARSPAKL